MNVQAYAAQEAGGKLSPYTYELPAIGKEEVDVKVHYCGLCHSDLSMLNNEWGSTRYPFVPGHEIVGEVVAVGTEVKGLKVGDLVGVGWFSSSCMHCPSCMGGEQHLCGEAQGVIVGRHGGFASHVRAHWSWAIALPEGTDMSKAGPLLCGGATVFNPILNTGVRPTDKVGVIGIGGLGHLALKFLKYWGCEVVAFSSNPAKTEEILAMGATKVVNSRSADSLATIKGQLNFIINTTNVALDWNAYLSCLAPNGRLHTVGAVLEPMQIPAFSLIGGQKSVSGSPVASPSDMLKMFEFCLRHDIYPEVQEFPMSQINEAIAHLEAGKARYRVVLKND